MSDVTFVETFLRVRDAQCVVRMQQGSQPRKVTLVPGTPLEITPSPGVWIRGEYGGYDPDHQEHYWRSDASHFVGLIDGMFVRVHPSLSDEA